MGVENMGENLRKFREEFQNTDRENEDMNEELLTEASLSVPAVTEPIQIPLTPISEPQFPINPTVPVSHSSGIASDSQLREMQERLSAICKPKSGASIRQYQGFSRDLILGKTGKPMYHQFLIWDL